MTAPGDNAASTPLRLLIVEDSEADAALLLRHLRRGGYEPEFERVDTAAAMRAALERRPWEVVISDFSMPGFGAKAALEVLQSTGLDIPFIVLSGTVGEEVAVELMRSGARDYILKDRLARLVPAIARELREAAVRAERLKMREQLLLSDRMASVGTLAAGVAHEINNPLAVIVVNLDLVAGEVSRLAQVRSATTGAAVSLDDLREPLYDAREAAERVRMIVRDLKVFSRPDEEKRGPIVVRHVVESSIRMAWNEIRHRARLVKDYGDVPPIQGNEARLGQVFLNLLVNAAQAIPEGDVDQHQIRVVTRMDPSGRVAVEVSDTGVGIPADVLPRIFDPFFTTKPIGVGTGLGLAICHRIVTAMGGEITVESRPGAGTLLRTLLPAATGPGTAPSIPAPRPAAVGRRGRVLVVDDEVLLCVAIQRALAPDHDVTTLTAARDALARITAGERFDVILCDLMMPEMTGMELYASLVGVAPEQADAMIFLTGGAFTSRARSFLDRVPNARLEKPIRVQNLRPLVRERIR